MSFVYYFAGCVSVLVLLGIWFAVEYIRYHRELEEFFKDPYADRRDKNGRLYK